MGAHRHGKVAVGAPFLRSRCDGRCLCRAVGMIWMEMALRLQQPHLCSSPYTDKGDEGRGGSGIGQGRDIRRGPGWISRATQPVCWVCYSSICVVRFKRQVIMQDDWCRL